MAIARLLADAEHGQSAGTNLRNPRNLRMRDPEGP
jgi:hypothetical protein